MRAGLLSSAAAVALLAAAQAPRWAVAVVVVALQVLLVLAWLAVLDIRDATGSFTVQVGAAACADALVLSESGARVAELVPVLGIALPAALLAQIARRRREDVTGSLAATMGGTTFVLGLATLVALRSGRSGSAALAVAAAGAGAALLVAAVADRLLPRPALGDAARGWAAMLLGLPAAAVAGAAYGSLTGELATTAGWHEALAAGAVALLTSVATSAGSVALAGAHERVRAALLPAAAVLPFAMAAPAAYVVSRITLG